MNPTSQTFSSVAGESVEIPVTVKDSAGAVVDVSGATVGCMLARRSGGATIVGTDLSPANASAVVTDGPNGVVTVTLDKTVTQALSGTYQGEIWIDGAGGSRVAVVRLFWTFGDSVRAF